MIGGAENPDRTDGDGLEPTEADAVARPEQPPMTDDASGVPDESKDDLGDDLGDFA